METVNINKAELLAKITENRELHAAVYREALEGWKAATLQLLNYQVSELQDGRVPKLGGWDLIPTDHTADYDQVITMLEMSVDDIIELDEEQFAQYVMDRWDWKRSWIANSAKFSETASNSSNYR